MKIDYKANYDLTSAVVGDVVFRIETTMLEFPSMMSRDIVVDIGAKKITLRDGGKVKIRGNRTWLLIDKNFDLWTSGKQWNRANETLYKMCCGGVRLKQVLAIADVLDQHN